MERRHKLSECAPIFPKCVRVIESDSTFSLIFKKCVIELHLIANLLLNHAWNFTTQIGKKTKTLNVKSL